MNPNPAEAFNRILAVLEPPEDMLLADWAEANIVIPQGQSARPGPTRMWPYLVEPLNAIGDRGIERVTVQKSARVGMTKCLIFAIAARAATDPCPIIFLAPRDEDARGMAVDEIEPIFRESPALKGLLRLGRGDGRNTLTRKSLAGGGSIKILSAMAPSNLRRHDCALLCADEVDGYKVTPEGDALALAERRTMAQPHPKIVCCSTPVDEDTSVITQRYSEGSQEIFEVPCPRCGAFNEIEWSHMEWENHDPETVKYLCPHCKEIIPERLLEAKRGGPSVSKVFRNTILGLPWRTTINRVDASILADRAEPWGLETPHHGVIIPDPVMLITCGVDTQDDRLEAVLIGFPIFGAPCILGHVHSIWNMRSMIAFSAESLI